MNGLKQSKKQLEKLARLKKEQLERDEAYMKEALKCAKRALKRGEIPVGAVIVKDGEIIARAQNCKESRDCAVYHAETVAIIKASKKLGWRLDGCTLYVNLEPCVMCAGAIASARISRVVFGMREPKSGALASRREIFENSGLNHRVEVEEGVLYEQCKQLWEGFFAVKRGAGKA